MAGRPSSILRGALTLLCWGMVLSHGLLPVESVHAAATKKPKGTTSKSAPAAAAGKDDTPKGSYMREIQERVARQWEQYRSERADGVDGGRVRTEFYVNQLGEVKDLEVVDARESHAVLTGMTLRAIRDTALPHMPAAVVASLQPKDEGRVKICYDAFVAPFTAATPFLPPLPPKPKQSPMTTPDVSQARKALPVEDGEILQAASPMGRYSKLVTGQVEKKWRMYVGLKAAALLEGELQVTFYVNPQGRVEELRIVNDKKSNPILTQATLHAIQDAEIPPMPADVIPLLPKKDQERLKIEYNALILPPANAPPAKTAVNAQADTSPKARYGRLVSVLVDKQWNLARLRQPPEDVPAGKVQLVFYVNPQGKVEDLKVVNDGADALLTFFTMKAIQETKIPPIPDDVIPALPKADRGRFKMEYSIILQ